jgi:preprotein translocase subunit SecA
MLNFFRRFFGMASERYLRKLAPLVKRINALESDLEKLSDKDLKARTPWLQKRLRNGETTDDILPDAFATVREAARRTLGQRHYDVQLLGGIVLHKGMIAEMKTGEGKTLVSTLPIYLNALSGQGVHVVTVNDYLAKRDSEWMGQVYDFLGLSVGCIVHDLSDAQRKTAYNADITYATNNELGFDYLRDHMKTRMDERVQRPFSFAVIDEVDSILIDEARTPLIISGPAEQSSELYKKIDELILHLEPKHYEKDEKNRSVVLTDDGVSHVEELARNAGLIKGADLYDTPNATVVHHIDQALKAHKSFTRDVDYIVKDKKVLLVDEFTGRIMDGRRFSDGLHQALEAKEHVPVEIENQTLASITYQNFFRLYPKLSGMTGTALTEAAELHEIYGLRVVAITTNKPIQRQDFDDEVYRTFEEKKRAVLKLIQEVHARKQPILVGTVSIEKSEIFSNLLKQHKIPHNVLNARHHQQEATIISEAGAPGAITIATNMAGRGTDIELGGSLKSRLQKIENSDLSETDKKTAIEKAKADIAKDHAFVLEQGGLFVIGTERHESRRIDNQLRGRSGRQGDPGKSKFFLSLEDDLMRIFGSERLDDWLKKLGLKEDEAITHPWINRALEKAQQKVEARNFDIRKHLLKYDDVMNDQRKVLYGWRDNIIADPGVAIQHLEQGLEQSLSSLVTKHIPDGTYPDQWDFDALSRDIQNILGLSITFTKADHGTREDVYQALETAVKTALSEKIKTYGDDTWNALQHHLLLRNLDKNWKDHLYALDHLRQGIHLRSYAQKDPLNEYKREAFAIFQDFFSRTTEETISDLLTFEAPSDVMKHYLRTLEEEDMGPMTLGTPEFGLPDETTEDDEPVMLSRNAPCPCGSGKRYKNCHGKLT